MNASSEDRLNAELAKLPRAVEPAHDLWPGIAARIAARRMEKRNRWSYLGAVAAIVTVAVSVTWMTLGQREQQTQSPAIATTVPGYRPSPADNAQPQTLFAAQLASDSQLPPKVRAALLTNLRLLHASIQRTEAALKKYPDDVNLQALLINLYQQQAQLMREAQQAQIQTNVRNML